MKKIEFLLELNRKKRSERRQKQTLKKLDIHEELLKKGFNISYATVKRLVKEIDERHKEPLFVRNMIMVMCVNLTG